MILVRPKPGPGLRNQLPVQKMIWNLYFLFHHRFRHKKLIRKNQSKGVHRVKKTNKTCFFLLRKSLLFVVNNDYIMWNVLRLYDQPSFYDVSFQVNMKL